MRVKRLEIQGFKSFKDKTIVHFDHSITGIVGPNGCGKSNIVDAFFWVMGEQSYKHMRGSSSNDLIFNGSSKYQPLGLAEATLVMENDFVDADPASGATVRDVPLHFRTKEVAVTRRLYRSGEGEYFINGVQARLKDIQELFMDTGVGAKGYSVIEQGQIGKVVNAKPEERRLLIEEAAGIAKYKARKKESLRKIEATQGNLSRLNDVIQEIERNLDSLERQAQKARLYNKYKAELLDKELTFGRRKANVIRQSLEKLTSQREILEQELVGLRAELQTTENVMAADQIAQTMDQRVAEDVQLKIQTLAEELTHLQASLQLSRSRQEDLHQQLESLGREKAELEISVSADKESISSRQISSRGNEELLVKAVKNASTKDESVRAVRQAAEQKRRALDEAKRTLMNAVAQSTDLSSKVASLASRAESSLEQAERLSQQVAALTEKTEQAREEFEKANTTAVDTRAKLEESRNENRVISGRVSELDQAARSAERERDQQDRQLTQLRSRLQSLEELAAAHEGFADGPKAALDWAKSEGKGSKVRALADGLEVSKGYEAAVQGWLGTALESLVTDDSTLAVKLLDVIREGKRGRASVHVFEPADAGAIDFNAVSGVLARNGFEVEGELNNFAKPLPAAHRRVVVVKDFAPVAAFVRDGGARDLGGWSVVALDGSVLHAGGALTGGSLESDGSATILLRKRTIADLQAEVASAEQVLNTKQQAVEEAREVLEITRAKQQELQALVQSLEIAKATAERDVHQMQRTFKDLESQLESVTFDEQEMRSEAERAQAGRNAAEEEIRAVTDKQEDLRTQIAEGEAELLNLESDLRSQEEELQRLRIDEVSLRERVQSAKRELEAGQSLLRDREARLQEVSRLLVRATTEREQHTGGDGGLEDRIRELHVELAAARERHAVLKDKLETVGARIKISIDRIKVLHSEGDRKTSDSNQFSVESQKFISDLENLTKNLEEKYGTGCLDLSALTPEVMAAINAEMTTEQEQLLEEEVVRLHERIRRLGEVNPMAAEEYDVMKKRYDHLVTEKGDLEQSMRNLQDAIDHINKTSEDRFKKAFEAIADRFEKLFPAIFGGGQACLSLVYPEGSTDILEAGVDILAQPPGKKVANITLLSGGEKALTAVSLIFAIFMVKPSPFCILDEVDAPLDDANIGKFNALLREMSAKSQFILITHNKRTMELNDTLYGVTMEEPGVSKMVSIEMH